MDKNILKKMVKDGGTVRSIAGQSGVSPTTVRYWLKKYGLQTSKKSLRRWTDEDLRVSVQKRECISDVLKDLSLAVRPGNYDTVKRAIIRLGLDTSHMKGKRLPRGGSRRVDLKELFRENSPHDRGIVKRRLVRDSLLPYRCDICGLCSWRGKPLVLVLDHINGIPDDHRLENLRFLCPNCNAQQPTFCRKKAS